MRVPVLALPAVVAAALALGACSAPDGVTLASADETRRIEVMYSFGGDQAAGFQEAVGRWARAHGAAVTYTQSDDLAGDIAARERSGRLPDVLLLPQPGLLHQLREHGTIDAVDDVVPVNRVATRLVPGLVEPLRSGGRTYGVPVAMSVKSLLWYDRHALHALELDPPQTLPELVATTRALRAAGRTPWCLGLAEGAGSGWPGTDWVEQLVLSQAGVQAYDGWVRGDVTFSDPRIQVAFRTYAEEVAGGSEGGGAAAATRDVRHAADGLFGDPQRCSLLKQGSQATQSGFLPDRVRRNLDRTASVVPFPVGTDGALQVGADSAALTRGHSMAAEELVRHMVTDVRFAVDWAGSEDRGFISPRTDFDLARYASTTTRKIAAAAYEAPVVRYDASDRMPPALGSGAFWRTMVDLTAGRVTVPQAVARLDAARARRG
ncbi:ABC transporter substrate-binding protein [Arsenicicoccus dermatophilus]|uniref:ABC transporter substrate-binding protein n=1 Tax=Arsenicicoccus dermatophilus TaxID=1076331 RepID=UPI003916E95C